MPKLAPDQGLSSHPMFKRILNAHMGGESCRSISKWCVPPIAHTTIARHIRLYVRPAVAQAEVTNAILLAASTSSDTSSNNTQHDDSKYVKQDDRIADTADAPPAPPTKFLLQDAKTIARNAILATPALQIRENRLRAQEDIHQRLLQVIRERGEDFQLCEHCRRPKDAHPWEEVLVSIDKEGKQIEVVNHCDKHVHVPGGTTGLLVRKLKTTGIEYAVDTAVLAEIRENQKQIAIELGQWQEGAPTGSVSIQIMVPTPGSGEAPRITFAAQSPAIESVRTIETTAKTDDEGGLEVMAVQPR